MAKSYARPRPPAARRRRTNSVRRPCRAAGYVQIAIGAITALAAAVRAVAALIQAIKP